MPTEPTPEPAAPDEQPPQPETLPPAEPEDRPEVEVLPPTTPAEPPAVVEKSALEHAAEELMATPGAPGRDEFLVLATTARILSMSAGAPVAVRNNPWLAFHLALIGRDLGISPSAAIAQVDVIGYDARATNFDAAYKNAQLSLSPELLNAQIKRMGLGSIVKAASSPTSCTAVALLPGGRVDVRCARTWPEHVQDEVRPCSCTFDLILGEVEFTWEDGKQAGLIDSACSGPEAHTGICVSGGSGSSGKRCHQGYRTYPQRMMWWRAAGWCQSDYFPEAGVGLYSPEELGAIVDPTTGRPVDPATAGLPEGYEEPERPHDPGDDLLSEADTDPENLDENLARERRELRGRIDAITAAGQEARDALQELWEQADDEGNRRTPPFPYLRRRHLVRARAVVKSVEDRIKKADREGGFGAEAKQAWADAAVSAAGFGGGAAQDAEKPPADDPPTDAPAGQEEPQEAPQNGDDEHAAKRAERAEQARAEVAAAAEAARVAREAEANAPVSDADLMAAVAADVDTMKPAEVILELERRQTSPEGRPANHRAQLAELLFTERRATAPAPEAPEA